MAFEQRWTAWGGAFGGYNRTSGDPAVIGSHDLTARTAGVAAGLDYHFSRDAVLGFALAGGGTNWSVADGLGGGKSDAFQAGVYAAARSGPAYLAASLAFAHHWMSTDRNAAFGNHLTAELQRPEHRRPRRERLPRRHAGQRDHAVCRPAGAELPHPDLQRDRRQRRRLRAHLQHQHRAQHPQRAGRPLRSRGRSLGAGRSERGADAAFTARLGARLGERSLARGGVPGAAGRELHRHWCHAGKGLRARLRRRRAQARQRRHALGKLDGEFASRAQTYTGTGTVRWAW